MIALTVQDDEGFWSEPATAQLQVIYRMPTAFTTETVSSGAVWDMSAIDADAEGNPHIVYYSRVSGARALKYAYRDASGWHHESVDAENTDYPQALYADIFFNRHLNTPHISYNCWEGEGPAQPILKHATRGTSGWEIWTLDDGTWEVGGEELGLWNAIDGEANHSWPSVIYTDDALGQLRLMPSRSHPVIIDTGPIAHTSVARAGGHEYISYQKGYGFGDASLMFAWESGGVWSTHTVAGPGGHCGGWNSIRRDAAGQCHISFEGGTQDELMYATGRETDWMVTTVDPWESGEYSSLALDRYGHVHISYYDNFSEDLKYAYWTGTQWLCTVIDTVGQVGKHTSIAVDDDGAPLISYYDETNDAIRCARGTFAAQQPPIATIDCVGPNPARPGQTVLFEGHGYDQDGSVVAYRWRSSLSGELSTQSSFSTTLPAGNHTIYFQVKDNSGAWSLITSRPLRVTAGASDPPPTAVIDAITPNPVGEGETVSFTGHGTDGGDGYVTNYEWSSSLDGLVSGEATFSTSELTYGVHTITFKVRDNGGAWSAPVYAELEVQPYPRPILLIEKLDALRDAVLSKMDVIADDYAWTAAHAYIGIQGDGGAMNLMREALGVADDFCSAVDLVYGDPSGYVSGIAAEICWNEVEDAGFRQRWLRATGACLDEVEATTVTQAHGQILPIIHTRSGGPNVDSLKAVMRARFDALDQYVLTHPVPSDVSFAFLLHNIDATRRNILETDLAGEDAVVRWYSPSGEGVPAQSSNVCVVHKMADWTADHNQCDVVQTMSVLREEAVQQHHVADQAYVTGTLAGGALCAAKILGTVLTSGLMVGAEVLIATEAYGYFATVLDGMVNSVDVIASSKVAIDNLKAVATATIDLRFLEKVIGDTERYVHLAQFPLTPPSIFAHGLLRVDEVNIPDIEVSPVSGMLVGGGTIKVVNLGPDEAKVNVYWDLKAISGPMANKTVSVAGPLDIQTVPVGVPTTIPFEFGVPVPELVNCEGLYRAWPHLTAGTSHLWFPNPLTVHPEDLIFRVNVRDGRGWGRDQIVEALMADSLAQGEVKDTLHTPTQYETRWCLTFPDQNLDLHLYDQHGNHVGINYETGLVEMQIPNSSYSGAWGVPEVISVQGTAGKQYRVEVKGVTTEGYQWFHLSALGTPERAGTVDVLPYDSRVLAAPVDTAVCLISLGEVGGHHPVTDVTMTASEFVGSGCTIPASCFSWQSSLDTIPAGGVISPWLRFVVPAGAPSGEYSGTVTIASSGGEEPAAFVLWVDQPPTRPGVPQGPETGSVGQEYSYTTFSSDVDGDSVLYRFDWGDGEFSDWLGPFATGQVCTGAHTWTQAGTFSVTVTAKDTPGLESEPSGIRTVVIGDPSGIEEESWDLPRQFSLSSPTPNPVTLRDPGQGQEIRYALPQDCRVKLTVFDVTGRVVTRLVDGEEKAGYKSVRVTLDRVPSGVYFCRLQAAGFVKSQRLVVLK